MNPVLVGLAFVLGAVIGSFVNVVIARLPAGESILRPGSRCPSCRTPIRWYDNIPLVSYGILGARCRACREPISLRYPLVEFSCGVLSAAALMRFGPDLKVLAPRLGGATGVLDSIGIICMAMVPYMVSFLFIAALVAISFIDLDHKIIPDIISLPGIAVGFFASFLPDQEHLVPVLFKDFTFPPFIESFLGAIFGFTFIWGFAVGYEWLMKREGMGMGDAKLLGMIGAFLGWQQLPLTVLLSSFCGSAVGILWARLKGQDIRTFPVPFGLFLAPSAVVNMFFGKAILGWYLGRMH